ncbi:hypothetical protein [uncultured Amnibacterium sp.]|uniref:hypothetical protein n=1 Tax=uncultured Amnibacterium sp. TaxID=1631851 RepID=UPI0035CBB741
MTAARAAERAARPAPRIAVTILFSLGFLWQVYGAVSNLIVWLTFAGSMGSGLSAVAWIVLLAGIVVPVVAFAAAVVVGRRRRAGSLALVLLLALCVSEALSLSQLAFFLSVIGAL